MRTESDSPLSSVLARCHGECFNRGTWESVKHPLRVFGHGPLSRLWQGGEFMSRIWLLLEIWLMSLSDPLLKHTHRALCCGIMIRIVNYICEMVKRVVGLAVETHF